MRAQPGRAVIGLISDTHGLLRPSVHKALEGVDTILHAGDVGGEEVLAELRVIAPVQAVYGNTDPVDDPSLTDTFVVNHGGLDIRVIHGHQLGSPAPAKLLRTFTEPVIVYGHTHRQLIHRDGERLVINPGAAGARRFNLEPSVARLTVENGHPEVELVALD